MLTLKHDVDAKTSNHHSRIAAIELFARDVFFDFFLARPWYFLDAVVRKGECGNYDVWVFVKGKTIVFA